jgi:hypothetical protein
MGQNAVAWQRRAISQSEHGKWDCLQDDRVADICTCAVLESLGRYVSDMRKKKEMGHRRDLGYTRAAVCRVSRACHVFCCSTRVQLCLVPHKQIRSLAQATLV